MFKKILFKRVLLKYAKQHPQGFTIFIDTFKIHELKPDQTIRYAVAITNNNTKKLIKRCLNSINRNFKGYLGGWYNAQNKMYYLDIVNIHRSLKHALNEGYRYNQIAIYDLWKDKEIKVSDKQEEK